VDALQGVIFPRGHYKSVLHFPVSNDFDIVDLVLRWTFSRLLTSFAEPGPFHLRACFVLCWAMISTVPLSDLPFRDTRRKLKRAIFDMKTDYPMDFLIMEADFNRVW
jgi:hypothetical protein